MEEVRLQLKWVHQAQFAGFYIAQAQGYYEQENIKVNFLEGGKGIDPAQQLISGKADFAVMGPESLIIKRSEGVPLVAVAAIYRRSAVVLAARQDSGIERPRDFLGKTVAAGGDKSGIRDLQVLFNALMKKLQVDISQIDIVAYDPTYEGFFKGDVDVTPLYYTGGVIKMRDQGLTPNLIWPSDYGTRFYSDILAVTAAMVQEKPDLVARFVRASLKGWQDIVGNFDQAVRIVLKYARIKDPELQKAMMEAMLPLVHTGRDNIGTMKPEIWQHMYDILREQGLLAHAFDVRHAYTLEFLKETDTGSRK
ncbi:MAG: ABC transporter substrate-binding protein [Deltaproteobacteria bacterium]|nr:ABC transporter substrate-binding protein [Deltaproteobacteria bacterium]MCF8120137.1 ABC transporter substrate-binding protein [Deltaproteobacteria bacterium]